MLVTAALEWPRQRSGTAAVRLALPPGASISSLAASEPIRAHMSGPSPLQYAPQASLLHIAPATAGAWSDASAISIRLRYMVSALDKNSGRTTEWEVNRISPAWAELGLYTPWFPLAVDLRKFTYVARVEVAGDYDVSGSGEITRTGSGWELRSRVPDLDCVILAAPVLHRLAGHVAEVVYAEAEHASTAETALADCEWLWRFFNAWLGAPADGHAPCLIIAPRSRGGGYARRGLVVVTPASLANQGQGLRYLGHEMAHLWWHAADTTTWEDWLNESFAEYCAVVAVRERLGDAAAAALLAAKRDAVATSLPPIRGLARTDRSAHSVLYDKGSLLLTDLAALVGSEKMTAILRAAHASIRTTADFLDLVGEVADRNAMRWLATQLER